jgi:hypothetical protein
MIARSWLAGAAAALALAAPATAAPPLTAEVARQKVAVHEDHLEIEALLSTEPVARSRRGLIPTPYNDNHLRAYVDRRTGQVRFELRQQMQYVDGIFRDFQTVNYEAGQWPATANLVRFDANRACESIEMPTACHEEVGFVLPEAVLRRLADHPAGAAWSLKFKPRLGREHRASLPRAEISGLLAAVDDYRRQLALTAAPALAANDTAARFR